MNKLKFDYFERDIDKQLTYWSKKDKIGEKTIAIIKGARRVGKTSALVHLEGNAFDSVLVINVELLDNNSYKQLMDKENRITFFSDYILTKFGIAELEKDVLVVFDEIQVHSDLKESLVLFNKTFECRFACTGSALWIEETEGTRPSPDFEYFKINPFSFSEFVSIIDPTQYENYCLEKELFFSNKTALEGKHNKSLYKLLREYIAVGGMPQVVSCYKNNYKNSNVYEMVHKCKRDKIIKVYEADLKKYDKLKNLKLSETYLNVIQNYGRIIDISEDNFTNFRKLEETNIVIFSLHIQNFNEKLNGSVDLYRIKPFLLDVGILFYYICGTENDNVARKLYKDFVLNKDGDDNGFLYENFVASTLNINKFGCFFKTFMDASEEDPNIQKQHEIDFVYSGINGIVALEAKSGGNKNCHSLLKGLLKYSKIKEGYILCKSYCFINTKGGQGPFYIPFYSLDFYK